MLVSTSRLTCLCGAVSESGDLIDAIQFPIPVGLCNCNSCRYSTGALACTSIQLRSSPSDASLAACSAYVSNQQMTRYFCRTCGTKTFFQLNDKRWCVLTGVIDRSDSDDVDTIVINRTWFINDTKDGGLVGRIVANLKSESNEEAMTTTFEIFNGDETHGQGISLEKVTGLWSASETVSHGDQIPASCHCGRIQFKVMSPDRIRNDLKDLDVYLRDHRTKYVAMLCTCRSCRLATGLPLQPWTYVMPENILTISGQPIDFNFNAELKNLPGLRYFYSRDNVRRSFCGVCGATVFYEAEGRPEVIDISIGILRSRTGALAADLVKWNWNRASHSEECRDKGLLKLILDQPNGG